MSGAIPPHSASSALILCLLVKSVFMEGVSLMWHLMRIYSLEIFVWSVLSETCFRIFLYY